MADPSATDPLSLLRLSIATSSPPSLSHTPNPPDPGSTTPISLSSASHLLFTHPILQSYLLSAPTRFHKSDSTPVDLRSIFFAWLHREDTIPDYISKAQSLGDGTVTNLAFLERLELVTWLEGGQEESEFIKALPAPSAPSATTGAQQQHGGAIGSLGRGGGGGGGTGNGHAGSSAAVLAGKVRATDPRLLEIYSYERVITNRNTLLRGIKPTDFSHVRKQAEDFITRLRTNKPATAAAAAAAAAASTPPTKSLPHRPGHPPASHPAAVAAASTIPSMPTPKPSKPSRSKDPIILLSPSASSLLTMANIKPFLEHGTFTASSSLPGPHPSIHHVSRLLPSIHATQPLRFIIVDSPEKFKPDYWDRVVAVFTTGQAWQFKGYKWSNPVELFREVRGYYVGWDGEKTPDVVRGWGAGVKCYNVERGRRFRDREVCEKVWEGVEVWMRGKGWGGSGGR